MVLFILLIYFIIFLSPPIVGLVLSAVGMKKQKSPINIAGLVLNIIAISLYILNIIF